MLKPLLICKQRRVAASNPLAVILYNIFAYFTYSTVVSISFFFIILCKKYTVGMIITIDNIFSKMNLFILEKVEGQAYPRITKQHDLEKALYKASVLKLFFVYTTTGYSLNVTFASTFIMFFSILCSS